HRVQATFSKKTTWWQAEQAKSFMGCGVPPRFHPIRLAPRVKENSGSAERAGGCAGRLERQARMELTFPPGTPHTGSMTKLMGAAVVALAFAVPASAACPGACPVPGGGPKRTDCYVQFGGLAPNLPAAKPRRVRCADGDPTCDTDGVVNGACRFVVSACLNTTDSRFPTCQSPGL